MAYYESVPIENDFDENSNDEDFLLALQLQQQLNGDEYEGTATDKSVQKLDQTQSMSVIDKQWELIDPNPNIYTLFQQFNQQFFYSKLGSVYVEWSKRMTRCAGICSYRRGGECRIALSASYLTLRPRKDLVETLLHEMIHAFLFVTHNNRDRDGHGPEFLTHMVRINDATGANISVYHTFHDEYDHLHGHWWRCTGSCRQWKPFFGYVKRSMNRAPSARDRWWSEHVRRCGGTFEKIKEPADYKAKENRKRTTAETASEPQVTSTQTKKKQKTNSNEVPSRGTIDSFFKKMNPVPSSSNAARTDRQRPCETRSPTGSPVMTSIQNETQTNYANCPTCNTLLPKANLFIHQVRCYK